MPETSPSLSVPLSAGSKLEAMVSLACGLHIYNVNIDWDGDRSVNDLMITHNAQGKTVVGINIIVQSVQRVETSFANSSEARCFSEKNKCPLT